MARTNLILMLAKRDLENRYAGSALGIVWSIIQPVISMLLMWFVFEYGLGLKVADSGVAYMPWLFAGMICWNFIAESLVQSSTVFVDYAYLIKKSHFQVHILPFVRILNALIFHVLFIAIVCLMSLAYGVNLNLKMLQLPYYLFCAICLALGLSLTLSAIVVFFRDASQILSIILQFGFWATPIVWGTSRLPESMRPLVSFNPAAYLVNGYRDSFFAGPWFFDQIKFTLSFWFITVLVVLFGGLVFNKLRPQFGDVL